MNNRLLIIEVGRSVYRGAAKTKHIKSFININCLIVRSRYEVPRCYKNEEFHDGFYQVRETPRRGVE